LPTSYRDRTNLSPATGWMSEPLADDLHLVRSGSMLPIQELGQPPAVPDETRLTIMGSQQEQTERMEALRGLIERLSAPDLTLVEATVWRDQVSDLLGGDDQEAGWDRMGPRSRGDGARHEIWPPHASIRAVG